MTQSPCILCCAITGSVATKADNPAVPTSIQEQIESSHEAVGGWCGDYSCACAQ